MQTRFTLPVIALAVLAVAPGCQNRRARTTTPPPVMAQAPVAPAYVAPPDTATKSDVYRMQETVDGLRNELAAVSGKLDEIQRAPAPLPPPVPMPAPVYELPPVAPPVASGEAEAARFADTLRSRGVGTVEQRGATVMVRLSDAFRSGSDNLKGDVGLAKTMQAVAEGLQLSPSARVQVIGHSDLKPIKKSPWENNTVLSRARAQTVARVLSENGVRSYIDVDGRGESEPLVSPERSKTDEAQNRRVEIHVTFG